MKNISLFIIAVFSLIFIQCEQDTFHQDFDQILHQEKSTPEMINTDQLKSMMNSKISTSIQPATQGELESRGNLPIYHAEKQVVEAEDWALLTLNKQYMADTCTFRTVISKISGNSGLYMYAYDGEEFTFIRGSYDENNNQEETHADLSDLAEKDTLLVFAIYGYEKSVFDIEIYQECETPEEINSQTVDNKAVATTIASKVLSELRSINRQLKFGYNYTDFIVQGNRNNTGNATFSDNTNYVSVSGTKKKDERTHNGTTMSSTYKDETTNLEINFVKFSKDGMIRLNSKVKYYQNYDFQSRLVYSTGQYASSWDASLKITADDLEINYTNPSAEKSYQDTFTMEIEANTRKLDSFIVKMTSKITGQAFHLYGVN